MNTFTVCSVSLRGRTLVDASAGTGKTFAITTLYVRLLLERGLRVDQVLVVTFTEAATAELRTRIRERLRGCLELLDGTAPSSDSMDPLAQIVNRLKSPRKARDRLQSALSDFDKSEISTIHGFCQRTLAQWALTSNAPYEGQLQADLRPLVRDLVLDFWANRTPALAPAFLSHLASHFSLHAAEGLAMSAGRNRQLHVLPPRPTQRADLQSALGALQSAFQQAGRLRRDVDLSALVASSGASARVYRRDYLERWSAELDTFLQSEDSLAVPKNFARFCVPALLEAGGSSVVLHPFIQACSALLAAHKAAASALATELVHFKLDLIEYVRQELPARSRAGGWLSFDDLLYTLGAALSGPHADALASSLVRRYPAALIDEFQDTDPVQYGIFQSIYATSSGSIFLIGDPKQAIYSFRGADIFTYLEAKQKTPANRRYTMGVNYRSDPSLLQALNALYARHKAPFVYPGIEYTPVEPRPGACNALRAADGSSLSGVELLLVPAPEQGKPAAEGLEAAVASDIAERLRGGAVIVGPQAEPSRPLQPSDIAVLTRENKQSYAMERALSACGVAAIVLGERSVFATEEAVELARVLAAIAQPGAHRLLSAALGTSLLGLGASDLEALHSEGPPSTGASETGEALQLDAWLERTHQWHAQWVHSGFVQMFNRLSEQTALDGRLLALSDGQRRLTNLRQLVELLHGYAVEKHLGPAGLLSLLKAEIASAGSMPAEAALTRLESDESAVKITTSHRSKGLQYGVVYAPYLWREVSLFKQERQRPIFHDRETGRTVDIGSQKLEESQKRAREEAFAESLRLAYVTLTRAQHLCCVVGGALPHAEGSALAHLLHPPDAASPPSLEGGRTTIGAFDSELEALAAHTPGLRLRSLSLQRRSSPLQLPPPDAGELRRKTLSRRVDDRFRTSSFTALTQAGGARDRALWLGERGAQDHDAQPLPGQSFARDSAPTLELADFPRGVQSGRFFHEILESYAFESARPRALQELTREHLTAHNFDQERWLQPVCRQLSAVLDTPLPTSQGNLTLGEIKTTKRINELEFWLPVAHTSRGSSAPAVHATDLREALAYGEQAQLPATYLERLGKLQFVPLRGFLRGFVDLVFEHEGRYYLVDYKASHLGDHAADYDTPAVVAAMTDGHYFLQYHLYVLALTRWLGLRKPGFSYAKHFGGVFYLFLKGMGPGHAGAGVYFERPPWVRVEALSRLLEKGQAPKRAHL